MPIRILSFLMLTLALLAGCSKSNSPVANDEPQLGKKIALVGFSGSNVALSKVAVLPEIVSDTLKLHEQYTLSPYSFIIQNVGDIAIEDLKVYVGDSILAVRRGDLGRLDVPSKQSVVPLLEIAVLTFGKHPWNNLDVATADTGYGETTLTFVDGDDTLAVYGVSWRAMIARIDTVWKSVGTLGDSAIVSNSGNCALVIDSDMWEPETLKAGEKTKISMSAYVEIQDIIYSRDSYKVTSECAMDIFDYVAIE